MTEHDTTLRKCRAAYEHDRETFTRPVSPLGGEPRATGPDRGSDASQFASAPVLVDGDGDDSFACGTDAGGGVR